MKTIAYLLFLLLGLSAQAQPGDPLPDVPPIPEPVVCPPPPVCLPVPSCPPPVVCPVPPPPPPEPVACPGVMKPVNITGPADAGGFAYWSLAFKGRTFGTPPDNQNTPTRSKLRLFEKTGAVVKELGPAHAKGRDIANIGMGRFAHWAGPDGRGEAIRFSASNNSDPRTNGKVYTYCVP